MALSVGTRLGPYEILGPLGAGGMGEVFRARDSRLQRDVALKVLPSDVAGDPDRLARFEREAQALAALQHPNILAIHDFATDTGIAYTVTELLDGQTLRERLRDGALPPRKATEFAAQMARGLAAAHDKGIVHRDLKPENVFITRDGRVKLLDFGLARSTVPGVTDETSDGGTMVAETRPGTVLGTMGYMSPEQLRGEPVGPRSDLFAFGAVLYEMLSGSRAFARDSAAETMSAVLKEDPPPLAPPGGALPAALERTIQHCLEKRPEERFQSARDLAFALDQATTGSSPDRTASAVHATAAESRSRLGRVPALAAAVLLTAVGVAGGWAAARRQAAPAIAAEPVFTRLTFGRGTIRSARFAPDGTTVVYGAAWDGNPMKVFFARTESSESTLLSFPPAEMLAVSRSGELALSLGHSFDGWMGEGTLARAPMLGAGPRPLLGNVREADWTPDGAEVAIVRRVGGRERLELPAGKVLYETTGWIGSMRLSPDGQLIAFADHPVFADDIGTVSVVDRAGKKTDLARGWDSMLRGLAWSPDGREVWFTASHGGEDSALRAVDLQGHVRLVLSGLARVIIYDIAPDGRVLLGRETFERRVEAVANGGEAHDFSLSREQSMSRHMSPDGRTVVVVDQSTRGYATYLRGSDGAPPVQLGTGEGHSISPDGAWVSTVTASPPMSIVLLPTGPGEKLTLPNPAEIIIDLTRWMPDGKHLVVLGPTPKAPSRGYIQAIDGTPPKPFTPEGVEVVRWWATPVSPDGSRIIARAPDGSITAYPVNGGAPEPLAGIPREAVPIEYSSDGKSVFVGHRTTTGWSVRRYDSASKRETPWREIVANDLAGLRLSQIYVTPDGKSYVHSYSRLLVDLYVAQGLR